MSKPATLEQIADWALAFTAEERSGAEYYYVPEPVKRLEWSILHAHGQLAALTGLQGTGKTSALNYLSIMLTKKGVKHVKIKWTENWRENLFAIDEKLSKLLERNIVGTIYEQLCAYGEAGKVFPFLGHRPTLDHMKPEVADQLYEKSGFHAELIVGKGKMKEIQNETLKQYMDNCVVILIDLPDYTKTNRSLMNKHLSEVQALWEMVVGQGKNIVTSIQKELFTGHFFFGKMMPYELTPLKPEEFVQVFKVQFPNCNFITDASLILLGQLSRGVFRRFLKYLKLTIDVFAISNEAPPIDVKHVNAAITLEQLMSDMELELFDIFKDANQRRQAVELLNRLRTGSMNQKEIAEFLSVGEMTAGKVVNRLMLYRYVERQRGEGKEWVISLRV